MDNLNKLARFDKTLTEFETELGTLKNTSEAYKKLDGLVTSYHKIGSHVESNSKIVTELATKFDDEHDEMKLTLHAISKANQDNFDKLRKENKEAYFDFEKTLKIKLEENKSEIKRLIEDERQKIKEIVVGEMNKIKNTILILGISTILLLIAVIAIQFLR